MKVNLYCELKLICSEFLDKKRFNNITEKFIAFKKSSANPTSKNWSKSSLIQLKLISNALHYDPDLMNKYPNPTVCELHARKILQGMYIFRFN